MFRHCFDYICHWLVSHSRHGTHSPFVYKLVDEVIYAYQARVPERVSGIKPAKINALINRLLEFWLKEPNEVRDYVLIGAEENYLVAFNQLLPKTHQGTLCIFRGIYRNTAQRAAWKTLINRDEVKVSIDLYYIGLIFFREGQAKENFKIRF